MSSTFTGITRRKLRSDIENALLEEAASYARFEEEAVRAATAARAARAARARVGRLLAIVGQSLADVEKAA